MSLITIIDSIPLFTKKSEALRWGRLNGYTGTHTHEYNNITAYMAGKNHNELPEVKLTTVVNSADQIRQLGDEILSDEISVGKELKKKRFRGTVVDNTGIYETGEQQPQEQEQEQEGQVTQQQTVQQQPPMTSSSTMTSSGGSGTGSSSTSGGGYSGGGGY
tara:strand:- start:180 stop:662 length:483 start_codon:yes stop_codon:yes gene_type:complete